MQRIARLIRVFSVFLFLPLAMIVCQNPSFPFLLSSPPPPTKYYSEIVIDTYYPLSSGTFTSQFQYMELFSASGVTSSADPWTSPTTGALDYDITGSNPDGNEANFAYIDYKPTTALPSGTVLYIRISGNTQTATGAYAIMVQTSPPPLTGGLAPASYYTFFSSALTTDPYAAGNNSPNSGGVPTDPAVITLGVAGALNRYLSAGAVEWVKLVLP